MTVWDQVVRSLEPFAADSLPDLCAIVRIRKGTRQPGGSYGPDVAVPVARDVPCRVSPAIASSVTLVAEAPEVLNRWQVAVWRGTDLRTGDQITASGTSADGVAWTRRLIVIAVDGPRTYEVLRTATCSEPATSGR